MNTLAMRVLGGVTAVMLMLSGCARKYPAVNLSEVPRPYKAEDFEKIREQWTRSAELLVVDGVEQRLIVDATFYSWEFRWAYVTRFATDATLNQADKDEMMASWLGASKSDHMFFVALASQYPRWADLTRSSTAWRVRLVDNLGHDIDASRIERIRRAGASDRVYFPYYTPFRTGFRIHFPRRLTRPDGSPGDELLGPGTRYFILRFSGPLGTSDLRWDVEEGHTLAAPEDNDAGVAATTDDASTTIAPSVSTQADAGAGG